MASTSAQMPYDPSPSMHRCLYDVFLSFRGEDTRDNFTDHLYTDLVRRGITTFRDDKLRRGEEIQPELLKAIEESRSSIVVFSQNYADSRWCLEELAKIMEYRKEYGQIVLPIFYHVDPSDIRKQRGNFGEAFTKYDYEENWKDKVERWREALTEAGNISGWHVKEGYESKHVEEITTIIANRILNGKPLFVEDNLVGIDLHFEKLSLELRMESNDVCLIGICGMGGIGKTTIASYVYNQIYWKFECSSFLEKVTEVYKNKGPLHLQNQLLNCILDGGNNISNVRQGAHEIKNNFQFRKALIVFDDVDDMDQLEFLVGNRDWYGKGSRIIITTRDKHLLNMLKVDYLHEVKQLHSNEALELLSQYVFGRNLPKKDFDEDLLNRVVYYCQGLPLALKVLGSLLCDKTRREWESELHKLEKEPEVKIQNVLKISFDGLDASQKVVFLDIACFFEGGDRDFISKVLDGCNLYGEINIRQLWERCLISISQCNSIHMHDLIKRMGWTIIQEQYPEEPSKWSRLWSPSDIYSAFISEKGMKNVETISLNLSISKEIWFNTKIFHQMKKVFAKMKKLRLLKVYYNYDYEVSILQEGHEYKMHLPKGFEFPPNLRYLHWENLESLPSKFRGENLVAINLMSSNIKELLTWEKCLAELKFIDLSNSQHLIKIPEFSRMPRLEKLNLKGCISFCELHSSIGTFSGMQFLKELNFRKSGIRELPSSFGSLIFLETLDLSKCWKFEKFPDMIFVNMGRLRRLELSKSGIKELPSSFGHLESLQYLGLSGCSNFYKFPEIQGNMKQLQFLNLERTAIRELPTSIVCLEALLCLSLHGCSNFERFPEIQKNMEKLCDLRLADTAIKELPHSIRHLTRIHLLSLEDCKNLKSVSGHIFQMKSLQEIYFNECSNLECFGEIIDDMEHLESLYLPDVVITKYLKRLTLNNCENLETLPNSIGKLTCLHSLLVHNCPRLQKLPDSLRSLQCCLETLDLSGCNLIEGAIPSDLWCLFSLLSLNVSNNNICCIPIGIIQLSQLNSLFMNHCPMLEEIPELPKSLRCIEAHGCPCLETLSSCPILWSYLLNCFKSQIQDLLKRTYVISTREHHKTNVVIPGSHGVPGWVSHKSIGHEIRIELPRNWYEDNNFLGFAFFCHHVPHNDDDDYICETIDGDTLSPYIDFPTVHLWISHGDQFEHMTHIRFNSVPDGGRYISRRGPSTSNPALRVAYFPQIEIPSKYRSSEWNNFKVCFVGSFEFGGKVALKMESCGIHLIYDNAQDNHQQGLQLFNVKRGHDDTKD